MRQYLLILTCLLIGTAAWADKKGKANADSLTIDSLRQANASLRQANDSLQRELNALSQFRAEFIKTRLLGESPDLEKPFSKDSTAEIDAYIEKLSQYKGNQEIDDYLVRVETYKKYQELYNHYSQLLRMPFVRDDIGRVFNDITKNLKSKAGNELTEAQYEQFDQLAVLMSRYYPGAKDFQELIKTMDAKLKNYKANPDDKATIEYCRPLVNTVLKQYDSTIKDRITRIEYLRERYETYKAALDENPLKLNAEAQKAVDEINDLKLD